MLKPVAGEGVGVFARKVIQPGTIVFSEKPLFIVTKPGGDVNYPEVKHEVAKLSNSGRADYETLHQGRNPKVPTKVTKICVPMQWKGAMVVLSFFKLLASIIPAYPTHHMTKTMLGKFLS